MLPGIFTNFLEKKQLNTNTIVHLNTRYFVNVKIIVMKTFLFFTTTGAKVVIFTGAIILSMAFQNPGNQKDKRAKMPVSDTIPKSEVIINIDIEKILAEVDKSLAAIDFDKIQKQVAESLQKIDQEKMKKDMEASLKNINWDKINLSIDSAMKNLDLKKMNEEIKKSLREMQKQLNSKEFKQSLEQAQKIDMKKIEKELKQAKIEIEKSREEIKKELQKQEAEKENNNSALSGNGFRFERTGLIIL